MYISISTLLEEDDLERSGSCMIALSLEGFALTIGAGNGEGVS